MNLISIALVFVITTFLFLHKRRKEKKNAMWKEEMDRVRTL